MIFFYFIPQKLHLNLFLFALQRISTIFEKPMTSDIKNRYVYKLVQKEN